MSGGRFLGGAGLAAVAVVCLGPVLALLLYALDQLALREVVELWCEPAQLEALRNTLILGSGTALLAGALGLLLATLVVRTDVPGARFFRRLFPLPFLVPPYVGALAWIHLANPKVGWLNEWLGGSVFDVHTVAGMVWVLSSFFYAVVFLSVSAALEQVDASLEEAARTCGAGRLQTLWHVTVPLVRPALFSSSVLVFAAAVAAFGVPALVGAPRRIWVLSTSVYQELATGGMNGLPRAAALSILLVFAPLLLFWLSEKFLRRRRHAVVSGKHGTSYRVALGRGRWPVFAGLAFTSFVLLALPFGAVVLVSVARNLGDLSPSGWSFARYQGLWQSGQDLRESMLRSFLLAAGAATLAVVAGAAIGWCKVRSRSALRLWPDVAAALPYAVPGTVVALGWIFLSTKLEDATVFSVTLQNTPWILMLAYFVKFLSFPARTAAESLGQVDLSLEQAARVSGARPWTTFRTISLPLLLPGLVAGWFLVFLPSFSELTMSVFLVAPNTETVGTRLFRMQEYGDAGQAAVLAVLVVLCVVACNAALRFSTRGRFGL